jgi:excisionase family DNA binding protein
MLIGAKELQAQYLRAYTVLTIREWARDGVIPSVRVGRKLMFDPVDVIAALKTRSAVRP